MPLHKVACAAAVLVAVLLLAGAGAGVMAPEGPNHCLDCHTTPARLVQAVREIADSARGIPTVSTAFEGSG